MPLTAGYSVAIDRKVIPLGSLLWLSTTRPDGSSLVRPVAAQDTGGAIAGEVRADLFWGTGEEAGHLAGDMKTEGQYLAAVAKRDGVAGGLKRARQKQ